MVFHSPCRNLLAEGVNRIEIAAPRKQPSLPRNYPRTDVSSGALLTLGKFLRVAEERRRHLIYDPMIPLARFIPREGLGSRGLIQLETKVMMSAQEAVLEILRLPGEEPRPERLQEA